MMIVLGLHFGHDAGASVVVDGQIASAIQRERLCRTKQAVTLDYATVESALDVAGVGVADVQYCAVTCTQNIELISQNPDLLAVEYNSHERHTVTSFLKQFEKTAGFTCLDYRKNLLNTVYRAKEPLNFPAGHQFPEYRFVPETSLGYAPYIDQFATCDLWNTREPRGLESMRAFPVNIALELKSLRYCFHYPLTVQLGGRTIPGYYIYHHQAHAASAYYPVRTRRAVVFCHDGGRDQDTRYNSGMIFFGHDQAILPIMPHNLGLGRLYSMIGQFLQLGRVSAPGKVMGLTSYGRPTFFEKQFVGNRADWEQKGFANFFARHWLDHCQQAAQAQGYDTSCFAQKERITEAFNADLAASTQRLFEEILLETVDATFEAFHNAEVEVEDLCFAGGIALNCPANSRLYNESRFRRIHVPPWCDDGGLAIGAALAVYYNLLDNPLPDHRPDHYCAYLGRETTPAQTEQILARHSDRLTWTRLADPARDAAQMIADNKIIGWMAGRSEIGPRALGHRSIFANATVAENWQRVNQIKQREQWRPFAPVVIEQDASQYFDGSPIPSPHMLFTSVVKGDTLPAITHVDRTSRVQTATPNDGDFYNILVHLKEMTGISVMLNTSFNGPGEPIVDTPEDAVRFLLNSQLDAAFLNGYKVQRINGQVSS